MWIAHHKNVISKAGFTLTELIITVAIIAILAAIAYPVYTGYISNAKTAEAKSNLQSLKLLLEQYYSENAIYCPAASCTGQSYTYTENNNGTVNTQTIITSYLTGFKPKSAAAGSQAVLYDYTIALTSNTAFTITAAPVSGRGAPAGSLTIDQDGAKTGW